MPQMIERPIAHRLQQIRVHRCFERECFAAAPQFEKYFLGEIFRDLTFANNTIGDKNQAGIPVSKDGIERRRLTTPETGKEFGISHNRRGRDVGREARAFFRQYTTVRANANGLMPKRNRRSVGCFSRAVS